MKRYFLVAAGCMNLVYGIVVSIWLGPSILADIRIAANSSKWPTTSGIVLESRALSVDNVMLAPVYLATVTYAYEVSYRKYGGSQVICECPSEIAADEMLLKFPKSTRTPVFYDPTHPVLSVVQTRDFDSAFLGKWGIEIAMILLFVAVLPFLLWMSVRGRIRTP